ncbi:putative ribonuclease H-like domain-containing protein [Tanacetum coccineum]
MFPLPSQQGNIDDKGYWDSGCSRHMTGNISYLSEYEPYDGGYVSFRHGGEKITGKGTIKTECLVLGKDFKVDDSQVLLRTPRQHNMYSIDLNNIVPHKNLTCLIAKASVDESMMWHRRLGHLNFKTMNKLVRNNLVKGLPSRSFENDHTCVVCLKGKQHNASCKTKFSWTFFLKTKDESGSILRNLITEIENLKDFKVKIIRCDNRGEFKNREMDEYYTKKGFLRPFGCHVMILNTLNHLGKFDTKGDEGTYSTNISGTKEDVNQAGKDNVSSLRFIALPNLFHDAHMETSNDSVRNSEVNDDPQKEQDGTIDVSESSGNTNPTASSKDSLANQVEHVLSPTVESEVPTVSSPVPTVSTNVLDSKSPKLPVSPTAETIVPLSFQEEGQATQSHCH